MSQHKVASPNMREHLSIEILQNGHLWSIVNHQQTGVILQKKYYAEYIGPGAAIGGPFDPECISIHVLGAVEYEIPKTDEMRFSAFQNRIKNIEQLKEICEISSPLNRGIAILVMFSQQFSLEEIQRIPNNLLAMLVGVAPSTITAAWKQFLANQRNAEVPPSVQSTGMLLNNVVSFYG
ncbi:hypothetical protein HRE53_26540 (plasmid) [Acaryochloris sp. 'Moss Beach']|uniref:hypothetical protein n=2 Tax=Acaryochloridaceae TaxID=1890429 RepID=UPI001BAEE891|nr:MULTISPECIES: hypothetical protein [Acaryochloris]QUY45889.1 hypothetical protein I1H34_29605 [Acaryochloris marina S15]UJB72464.1 hypothetical protein HRE53_26540 [Acaryochloris sp. 'Moss Beach']